MKVDSYSNYTPDERATYRKIKKIKRYVKETYGIDVYTSYIVQVKRRCDQDMGENYNQPRKDNTEVKQYP